MKRQRQPRHFPIGQYVLQVHAPTRRRWGRTRSEWRFLLLGPQPDDLLRPTTAAGDIVDGRVFLDFGAASLEQIAAIEALKL